MTPFRIRPSVDSSWRSITPLRVTRSGAGKRGSGRWRILASGGKSPWYSIGWADWLSRKRSQRLANPSCTPDASVPSASTAGCALHRHRVGRVKDVSESVKAEVLEPIENGELINAADLYAACEFLDGCSSQSSHWIFGKRRRIRSSNLPAEFLLSLKPAQVEHPDWMHSHCGAWRWLPWIRTCRALSFCRAGRWKTGK